MISPWDEQEWDDEQCYTCTKLIDPEEGGLYAEGFCSERCKRSGGDIINSVKQLLSQWAEVDESPDPVARMRKLLFKYTDSGVAFAETHEPRGVSVMGYVEGWDGELEPTVLPFPFWIEEFHDAVREQDEEACRTWDEVHNKEEENE